MHWLFPLSGILHLFASKFLTFLYFMEMLWLHFCYFKTLCVFSLFWFWVSFLGCFFFCFPNQRLNLHLLLWEHGALTTGPPGKSDPVCF